MIRPVAFTVGAAVLAGCTSSPDRRAGESSAPAKIRHVQHAGEDAQRLDETMRALVDTTTPAVVRIFFGDGDMLTGTIVSRDGLVLTCAHLPVPIGEPVTIGLWDGRNVSASVLSKLPEQGESRVGKDLALLQIRERGPWPYAPVAAAAPVSTDSPLIAIGFPDTMLYGQDRTADPAYVRMGFQTIDPYQSNAAELPTSIRATGGDSGGPLFDLNGHVVGVVHAGDLSGAHCTYTRIEVLRQNWTRLAKDRTPPVIPEVRSHPPASLASISQVASAARSSVVEVLSNSRWIAQGCVVGVGGEGGEGLILTKASELGPNLTVVTANDHVGIVDVVATDPTLDIALLRLTHAPELTRHIKPIDWNAAARPTAGTLVVLATSTFVAPQVGVTCFEARDVPAIRGFIPCQFEQRPDGFLVVNIANELRKFRLRPLPQPLRIGDILTHIEGAPVPTLAAYQQLMTDGPRIGDHPRVAGEPIRITVKRGDRTFDDVVGLEFDRSPSGQLVRPASARYSGFPKAIATDLPARPEHCGAPVVDADGRVVGMLIARAPFIESLVLPSDVIAPALERMKQHVPPAQ